MKTIKLLPAALVSVFLLTGVATQASAMAPERLPTLLAGESPARLIGGVDHYRINVQNNTQLSIRSHKWPSESSGIVRMNARLLDANGRIVAEGRGSNGQFALDHSVTPGEYTLELEGHQSGDDTHRYFLSTRMN